MSTFIVLYGLHTNVACMFGIAHYRHQAMELCFYEAYDFPLSYRVLYGFVAHVRNALTDHFNLPISAI